MVFKELQHDFPVHSLRRATSSTGQHLQPRMCTLEALSFSIFSITQQFTSMGSFGKGSLQPTFRRISAPFPDAIQCIVFVLFPRISAEFPQTFRQNPFANDPTSELLNYLGPAKTFLLRDTPQTLQLEPGA